MPETEHIRRYRLIEIVGPEEAVTKHMNDTCHHLSKVFENGVIENQVEIEILYPKSSTHFADVRAIICQNRRT